MTASQREANRTGPAEAGRAALVAALSHPVRSRLMHELSSAPRLGVSELAERTRFSERVVRRQLEALLRDGLVGIRSREVRRGTVKRYYVNLEAPWMDAAMDAELTEAERRRVSLGVLRLLFEVAREALASGDFTARVDRVVAETTGDVDERGWEELSKLHHELLRRSQETIAASRERLLAPAGGEPIAVLTGQILVQRRAPGPSR